MKIFEKDGAWHGKINFVDVNNVVLGFDMTQDCCESFGWFVTDIEGKRSDNYSELEKPEVLEPYVFDTSVKPTSPPQDTEEDYFPDGGGDLYFKIIADGKPDMWICIYNHHNGYYGHGFEWMKGKETLETGCL